MHTYTEKKKVNSKNNNPNMQLELNKEMNIKLI